MNKTAIKNFAIWARNKLIADITYRAGLMGITAEGIQISLPQSTGTTEFYDIGTAEPYSISGTEVKQREKLVELIRKKEKETNYKTAYKCVLEEVAYTWFNRLIAVRFMEVNDYLPSHIRVISSDFGKTEPDLLTNPFGAELSFTAVEEQEIYSLKKENKSDDVFRLLFIKQCNALNEILPALFEKTSDYTELLLNLSIIDQDGVIWHLVHDISEEDFDVERGGQVEIIGWLYQYYNTEPKNEAFAKKGKISKEEIPAVTQLFTPDWIVRYMVENSLGRLWIEHLRALDESADESALAASFGWKYYLPEAKQEPEVETELRELRKECASLTPGQITTIDPCMGSGHILVYVFDVLMRIYESAGYGQRDAARSILENNLYGLDIDDRAFQMAYFAVMMKARQYNRRILNGEYKPNVYSIQESNGINRDQLKYFGAGLNDFEKNNAITQINGLLDTFKDAKEYGSILTVDQYDWDLLKHFVSNIEEIGQLSMYTMGLDDTAEQLKQMIAQGKVLAQKYHVTTTNPPYMGSDSMDSILATYVKKNFNNSRADLYAVFIIACNNMLRKRGIQAMITQHSWMFLSSFEKLRANLINNQYFINMAHLGARAFEEISGEVVQTVSWIMRNGSLNYNGVYSRLVEPNTQDGKENLFLQKTSLSTHLQKEFAKIPAMPIAYWISEEFQKLFEEGNKITKLVSSRDGLTTGKNDLYIRQFWEVPYSHIGFNKRSAEEFWETGVKFAPLLKGGLYRKWYGNNWFVITYDLDGYRKLSTVGNKLPSREDYFRPYISWNRISTRMAFRYCENGCLFESASLVAFAEDKKKMLLALAFANSVLAKDEMQLINPTTNMLSGYVDALTLPRMSAEDSSDCIDLANECVELSKEDWDENETSWDYKRNPLLGRSCSLKDAFEDYQRECEKRFQTVKDNEERINKILVSAAGLLEEFDCAVDEKDVSIRLADRETEVKALLSYAVGCMFGRYSLDIPGLLCSDAVLPTDSYISFIPDMDNVIPVTDEEYLEDDIISRLCEWLKKAFGEDTLEENLDYIAQSLNIRGNFSREIIRNYLLNAFIADHTKTYQRKPIYLLFDSGKENGFKALIYLHRYNADTIGNLRIDYLHRMQRIYESEMSRMQDMIDHSSNAREVAQVTKRREKLAKQLKECQEYDEKLAHLALSRIELDLDDGVKKNYRKIQTANDDKFYEVLADSKNIMSKE